MPRFVRVRDAPNNPGGRWVEDKDVVIPVIKGDQGLQGFKGDKGDKGDTSVLRDDPDPTLTADLQLAGHKIVGTLDNDTLVIDGGLI